MLVLMLFDTPAADIVADVAGGCLLWCCWRYIVVGVLLAAARRGNEDPCWLR